MAEPLGLITRGSLSQGLQLKLEPGCSVEDMRVGRFVVIEGRENRFFCLVTDMELGATNPRVLLDPPVGNRLAGVVLDGITTFGQVAVTPMLMLPRDEAPAAHAGGATAGNGAGPAGVCNTSLLQPVRTIPVHFSSVFDATEEDFAAVFGREEGAHFAVGMPLNMDIPV